MATVSFDGNTRRLRFEDPVIATYWRDRIRSHITEFQSHDSLRIVFQPGDNSVRFNHSGAWSSSDITTSDSELAITSSGGAHSLALGDGIAYDSLDLQRIPSGSVFDSDIRSYDAVDAWSATVASDTITLTFSSEEAASEFSASVNAEDYGYDKELTELIRFREQSSTAATLNFVGLDLSTPGIGTTTTSGRSVTISELTGQSTTFANGYVSGTTRPYTQFAFYDADSDQTYVIGSPRVRPVHINSRGSPSVAAAGIMGATMTDSAAVGRRSSWAGDANLMRPGRGKAPALTPVSRSTRFSG